MPSAVCHAVIGGALGIAGTLGWCVPENEGDATQRALALARHARTLRWFPLLAAALSVVPDADTLMHAFVAYSHPLGHRGAFHSAAFYFVLCAVIAGLPTFTHARTRVFSALFAAMLSHSLLDMLTNGGLGIAIFWPLSSQRWFFPWRPIPVSPLAVGAFFTARGLHILSYELLFAVPVMAAALVLVGYRGGKRRAEDRGYSAVESKPEL